MNGNSTPGPAVSPCPVERRGGGWAGPGFSRPGPEPAPEPTADSLVRGAVSVLFAHRHTLASDVLRSLADIWTCASAARFGRPYETWWIDDLSLYTEHNTAECEAQNAPAVDGGC